MAFSALLLMLNVYVVTNKISVTRRTTGLAAFFTRFSSRGKMPALHMALRAHSIYTKNAVQTKTVL